MDQNPQGMPIPEKPQNTTPNPINTVFPNPLPNANPGMPLVQQQHVPEQPLHVNPDTPPMYPPQAAPQQPPAYPQQVPAQQMPPQQQPVYQQPVYPQQIPAQQTPVQQAQAYQQPAQQAQAIVVPDAPNVITLINGTRIEYSDYNENFMRILTEGVDPKSIKLELFPENLRTLVLENMKGIILGASESAESEDDDEEGLETIEQKHLRTFRLKKDSGGTKGVFQVKHGEDYLTVPGKHTVDVFVLARGVQRQYRVDRKDMNAGPPECVGYHTGKAEKQIPTLFNEPGTDRVVPRHCTPEGCPVHPKNPRCPRGKRCQSSFVYILVMRHDMTQVLRMFEPMKNYKNEQQRKFKKVIQDAHQEIPELSKSHWIKFTGQEFSIPKSQFTSAVMTPTQSDLLNPAEIAILDMWRSLIAIPYLEGSKSYQFARVKGFIQEALTKQPIAASGQAGDLHGGLRF